MLQWRGRLAAALALAAFSAVGLGVGLLSLGPVLSLILEPERGQSLPELAASWNADTHAMAVPQWAIDALPDGRFEGVIAILVGVLCLTVLGGLANFLHQWAGAWIAVRVVADVRGSALRHVVRVELGRVLRRGASEYVARIVRDAAELQYGLTILVGKSVAQLTKGAAAFAAACVFDIRLVLAAVVVFPVLMLSLRGIGRRVRRGTAASLEAQQDLLRIATEAIQGLRAVKVNTGERGVEERFNEANDRVIAAEMKVRIARALASPLMETLAIIVLGTLAAIAARGIMAGSMDFDRFLLSIGSLAVAGGALRPLASLVAEIQAAEAPAERLQEVLDEPLEQLHPGAAVPRHVGELVFDDVTVRYDSDGPAAVDAFSARVPHGQRVAVVGPNGCGKTTLVSLVPRLLRPQEGRVTLDGLDLAEADLASLRGQVGVVTQETVLFRGSVAQNIAFGHEASGEEIEAAARAAHAHEFIQTLPSGYDSDLYEQGTSLSGGQRQRLAIARALLRDPAILILDEATSQIDAESEAMINDTLEQACAGRTVLLVAHRLSTVLTADRILVMDAGSLVGDGTHEALLVDCQVYQRLARTQLAAAGTEG